ncbi:MAG: hypothetical protein ABI832_08285 [bacterium]
MRFIVFVAALFLASPLMAQGISRWIGQGPSEILADESWQVQFVGVIGNDGLRRLQDDLVVEEPVVRDGDWIVGTGCAPHQCGDVMGGFAISISTGEILAVVHDDAGIKVWGDLTHLPGALSGMVVE